MPDQTEQPAIGSSAPPAPRTRDIFRCSPTHIDPDWRSGTDGERFYQVDMVTEFGEAVHAYVNEHAHNRARFESNGMVPGATDCFGKWFDGFYYENKDKNNLNSDSEFFSCAPPPPRSEDFNEVEDNGPAAESVVDLSDKTDSKSQYPAQFEGCEPPKELWANKRFGNKLVKDDLGVLQTGLLHLCGVGDKQAPVMFVGPCAYREDYRTSYSSKASLLRLAPGNLFTRYVARVGFQKHDWFYTTLVKYNTFKLKIKPADVRWNEAILLDEVNTIKPKIIVCMGKDVFDFFWQRGMGEARRFALKDVQGGFFECKALGCVLYPMDTIMTPLTKPEYLDRFETDLTQVRRSLDEMQGFRTITKVEQKYVTIENTPTLVNVLARLMTRKVTVMSVDCEWHGQTWVDGALRSFQFGWAPGEAAYLKLMNDKQEYCFDQPLPVVRNMLKPHFNNPEVKFIGHNASADMPWMDHHLGIAVYRRFLFDTMYAQHTANEYADLKLERCAVKYTDLGRYDIELCLWKKRNGFDEENEPGYGRVPDKIIIPYGLRDVDATFRLWWPLTDRLVREGLLRYYNTFVLPFVTDGFYEMMDAGLPINEAYLDDMREVFVRNQELLQQQFRIVIQNEAGMKLITLLKSINPAEGENFALDVADVIRLNTKEGVVNVECDEVKDAVERFKTFIGTKNLGIGLACLDHFIDSSQFNINSTDHLKRWLFKVKGLQPLKSTKRDGFQLSWEKVLAMDKKKQENFEPAADKQTIKIYADKDQVVAQLQELKSIGNIVKAFLKGKDEEGREQGIPKWIQSDGRIHANFALTETARPRAWKPNILNWPKAVTRPIEAAFARIQKAYPAHAEKPACLRSVVEAPAGGCIIDMDLKTAEVVALAYQAGDEMMIRVLTEPDTQFARIDAENPKKVARIAYNGNSSFPEEEWDKTLLVPIDDPRILRKPDGAILHPKRDLHWEMAEAVASKPREKLDERLYRDGCGKVGNFSIPYGASPPLLERLIEVNTGIKPKEGTGELMITTWETRYPDAAKFQREMAACVESPGMWLSLSGRRRHFFLADLADINGIRDQDRQKILSPLERQARNFPCQELVAATTGKAVLYFIEKRREMGLRSRIGILLYDAITAFSPLEEAKVTAELLKNCLTTWNPWTVKGRTFNFEVDISFGFRWGVKMTKEEKERIAPYIK